MVELATNAASLNSKEEDRFVSDDQTCERIARLVADNRKLKCELQQLRQWIEVCRYGAPHDASEASNQAAEPIRRRSTRAPKRIKK